MATKQKSEAGSRKSEYVIKRGGRYLTASGGWTNNQDLAQTFASEGAARSTLRNRAGEITFTQSF